MKKNNELRHFEIGIYSIVRGRNRQGVSFFFTHVRALWGHAAYQGLLGLQMLGAERGHKEKKE